MCKVVLHNIALDRNLVQLYQLHFSEKKTVVLEHSSPCINTSKKSSNNIWILKENMRQDNTEDETFRLTRSRSKKLMKKINEECKNVEFLDDVSYNHRIIQLEEPTAQKQQLKLDISVKSFSNKSTSMNSMKIDCDNESYLNEENLNVIDCNSKMQEISSKSIKKYNNNNLCTISSVINGRVCNVRLEQCETNQNSKETEDKINFKSKNANPSNNLFTLYNTNRTQDQKDVKRSSNKITILGVDSIQATSIPKSFSLNMTPITVRNHILPKGTIKFVKGNTSDESLQSNVSNDTNNSTKQVSYTNDTFKSTNILTEKDYHIPEIDKSIDISKVSESTLVFNNNINLKNKSIDNNEHHSSKVNKNIDSLEIKNNVHNNINNTDSVTREIYENCIWNRQKQLNRLNNREKHENNILQNDKKCKKISSENILNKNTSNLVDVNENCNATKSLILANKKETMKQNRKRIAAENIIKLDNKKMKLNRTLWLQNNVTHIKLLNPQEFDFPNINTAAESNVSEENIPVQKIDVREYLNKNRSKSPKLFENKFNNKTSIESEQINLNNKSGIITPTNTMKNEKFYKRFSFEKESTFNKTLCKEIDIQTDSICNNRMYSMLQSTSEKTQHLNQIDRSINENANTQEEHMNSRNEDDDDCISLFAESFDTNLYENTVLCEQDKLNKSLHSDVPYIMTTSSFDKYIKQNATEFNKEYAKCVEDNIEMSNKTNKTDKNEFNNQSEQITHTDYISETRTKSKVTALETKSMKVSKCQGLAKINLKNFLNGYCFSILRKGTCYKQQLCKFKHENIIKELLNRGLPLKAIMNHLVEYIPINDSNNLMNILECIEKYIKRGEYWNTIRTLVLRLPPDKHIIENILIANNSHSTVQNFGEGLPETIASPDGSMSLSQESPRHDNTFINKSKDHVNIEMNGENYIMQPIEKQDESPLFVHSCCNILRTETKIFYVLVVISDQSSQYYPIDLSRYVDKLIMLSLSKKDSNLITEIANLVLKYTFALSTTTCRALVSTLIHMNENLARQMYNYAEEIGIYPAVKVNT
ncbi:hypothetical protein ALC56_00157 [Trachymyrmex septentrionalis]|uniref:Uncharacterized protein n=1 Tax=Trachymyrmex septentrionalis TaxID=34720 RepID=A0A195FXZ8_9HYME|nr:hypothetical protein ALC56_00157 [Trachymyrmex septentrionalis]